MFSAGAEGARTGPSRQPRRRAARPGEGESGGRGETARQAETGRRPRRGRGVGGLRPGAAEPGRVRDAGVKAMNWNELHEIEERIARLNPAERLYLIERLARLIRLEQFTD